MGPNYVHGKKEHQFMHKKIIGMMIFAGKRQEQVDSVSVGNTCGLTGMLSVICILAYIYIRRERERGRGRVREWWVRGRGREREKRNGNGKGNGKVKGRLENE